MLKKILFVVFCLTLASSCVNKDEFYTNKGSFDYVRIPLLKPYDITKTNEYWIFSYKTGDYNIDFSSRVTGVNVIDSIIVVYTKEKSNTNVDPDSSWSFIVPSKKIGVKFRDKKKFEDSLYFYTKKKIHFINIDEVWSKYSETGYLDWFPQEYKPN